MYIVYSAVLRAEQLKREEIQKMKMEQMSVQNNTCNQLHCFVVVDKDPVLWLFYKPLLLVALLPFVCFLASALKRAYS